MKPSELDYPIINLENLLIDKSEQSDKKDKAYKDLEVIQNCLERRGWFFIETDDSTKLLVDQVFKEMETFFTSNSLEDKMKYCYPPRYGFVKTDFKEAYRMLTGKFGDSMKLPPNISQIIQMGKWLDESAKKLIGWLGPMFNIDEKNKPKDENNDPFKKVCLLMKNKEF